MVNPAISKAPVFLFIGNDSYLKDRALEELSSSVLGDSSKELDYRVFYAGESDLREILDCATTIPLSAKRKIIVLKDADRLPGADKKRLIDYIKNPVNSTCFVLESLDDSFLAEDGSLSGLISVRRFDHPAGEEIGSWIKGFLKSAATSKTISSDAVETLKELQGHNLLSLRQELEKLMAFVGDRSEISTDDVGKVVGKSLLASAFDLTDAIEFKRIDDAIHVISDLVLSGKKHYEIIGLLCWHLKRQMKARLARDKGETDFRIASMLRIPRRYADEFFGQLASLDIDKIRRRMQILLESDLDLKRTKYDPALVLEFAVIRMTLI